MSTRYFKTLISKTDLQKLRTELKKEQAKPENKEKHLVLLSTAKHYFLETNAAENLKEFFLEFEFTECGKPKERVVSL